MGGAIIFSVDLKTIMRHLISKMKSVDCYNAQVLMPVGFSQRYIRSGSKNATLSFARTMCRCKKFDQMIGFLTDSDSEKGFLVISQL